MDLRSRIHSEKSKESLEANMAQYTQQINEYLAGGEEYKKIYFKNHLGRELCNKLYNYDLKEYLPPSSDGGLRPDNMDHLDVPVPTRIAIDGGNASLTSSYDGNLLITNETTGAGITVVKYDFLSVYPINGYNIKGYRFFITPGNYSRWSTFVIEASNDDHTWDQIGPSYSSDSEFLDYSYSGFTANYRYYRLRVTGFGRNGRGELDFLEFI